MVKIIFWFVALLIVLPITINAQKTAVNNQPMQAFREGNRLFDQQLYEAARVKYQEVLSFEEHISAPENRLLQVEAAAQIMLTALYLEDPDIEIQINTFVDKYSRDPMAHASLVRIGDHYYTQKSYNKVIEYFQSLPVDKFDPDYQSEIYFKVGYAHFSKKDFALAESSLEKGSKIETEYYYPTNYYLAMCHYYDDDYEKAIEGFLLVEESNLYESFIPYYLCQIYFSRSEYERVTNYGPESLNSSKTKNRPEIKGLIGKSFFELGQYSEALPYLQEYSDAMVQLTQEEFYQVALVQYKEGLYEDAAENFRRISGQDNAIGQNANYFLGDCFVQLNNFESARSAFANAKRLDYDPKITVEATYHYGLLSAALNFDREAVNALMDIPSNSSYYFQAQETIGEILVRTSDYQNAIDIIESLAERTPKIQAAYQKVTLFRAQQLIRQGDLVGAEVLLDRSLSAAVDLNLQAQALFWKGETAFRTDQYESSKETLNGFFTLKSRLDAANSNLVYLANYTQGYNYLKSEYFQRAGNYFQDAAAGIKADFTKINDPYIRRDVLGDALLRAGDCYFQSNEYSTAKNFYDEAIRKEIGAVDYAKFQTALISGLLKDNVGKIITLESLVKAQPESPYADDALLETGRTYMSEGEFGQAIAAFDQLISNYEQSPLVAEALIRSGLSSYNQGDTKSAIEYYKRVFEYNPDAEQKDAALSGLEEIYLNDVGDADAYLSFLQTVKGTSVPDDRRDSLNFYTADVKYRNALYDEAIDAFRKYINAFPYGNYRVEAFYKLGESHAVSTSYDQALEAYKEVIESGPGRYYTDALNKAALINYNHKEDYDRALYYYNLLKDAAPTDQMRHESILGGIRAAFRSGHYRETIELINLAFESRLTSAEERNEILFYQGKTAFESKDFETAITAFNELSAKENSERAAEGRYLIAYIYYARKEVDLAEEMARNAVQLNNQYPSWVARGLLLLSDVMVEKRDYFNARAPLEAVIENYQDNPEIVQEAQLKLESVKEKAKINANIREESTSDSLELDKNGQ